MDRVTNGALFSAIVSSQILIPYLQNDPELEVLLENPNHCNIHYPQNYTTVEQIIPVLRQMLEYMLAKRIYLNLDAAKQLISFSEKNPDCQLYDITFNCERRHYGVCCAQTGQKLQVVCVLTGNHIPDELFEESIK